MGRKGSVASFFNFIDRQNNAIADRAQGKDPDTGVGIDRHQVERMEARRETAQAEGDRLRARPRGRSRPVSGRIVRGHMENPGAE